MAGVELSAEGAPGKCHLLGLGIDPAHAEMNETLAQLSANRRERNEKIAQRLTSLGVPLTLDEVTRSAPDGISSRTRLNVPRSCRASTSSALPSGSQAIPEIPRPATAYARGLLSAPAYTLSGVLRSDQATSVPSGDHSGVAP